MYALIVVVTVAVHYAFVLYVVFGGFLALRWPHAFWPHLLSVIWAAANALVHVPCPLTGLERWARARGGMAPLPDAGFIDHYITGVLYPRDLASAAEIAAFAVIALSWALLVRRRLAARTAVR